jgi:hypothetical protein
MAADREVAAVLATSRHLRAAYLVVLTVTNAGDPQQYVISAA